MPRKSASKSSAPTSAIPPFHTTHETEWGGYINFTLSEDDLAAYRVWYEMNEAYLDASVADCVGKGVQFNLRWQHEHNSYTCSLTTKPSPELNLRVVMTTWANSPIQALAMSIYKWQVLLGEDLSDYLAAKSQFKRFG